MTKNTPTALASNKKGNRCGFLLSLPRFLPEHPHPFLADIQRRAQRLFRDRRGKVAFYWGRKRTRKSAAGAAGTVHDQAPRGERAEAIVLVAQNSLKHMEIRNLRIVARPGSQDGVSVAVHARETGLSIDRVNGALADLKSCGLLDGYQRRDELPNGKYRGLVALRWFTEKFFDLLGALKKLLRFRKGPNVNTPKPTPAPAPEPTGPLKRKIESLKWIIAHEHPEFSLEQVEQEAHRRAVDALLG
jgi:hypothetical protein